MTLSVSSEYYFRIAVCVLNWIYARLLFLLGLHLCLLTIKSIWYPLNSQASISDTDSKIHLTLKITVP
jgi:hypothetical protein